MGREGTGSTTGVGGVGCCSGSAGRRPGSCCSCSAAGVDTALADGLRVRIQPLCWGCLVHALSCSCSLDVARSGRRDGPRGRIHSSVCASRIHRGFCTARGRRRSVDGRGTATRAVTAGTGAATVCAGTATVLVVARMWNPTVTKMATMMTNAVTAATGIETTTNTMPQVERANQTTSAATRNLPVGRRSSRMINPVSEVPNPTTTGHTTALMTLLRPSRYRSANDMKDWNGSLTLASGAGRRNRIWTL